MHFTANMHKHLLVKQVTADSGYHSCNHRPDGDIAVTASAVLLVQVRHGCGLSSVRIESVAAAGDGVRGGGDGGAGRG